MAIFAVVLLVSCEIITWTGCFISQGSYNQSTFITHQELDRTNAPEPNAMNFIIIKDLKL